MDTFILSIMNFLIFIILKGASSRWAAERIMANYEGKFHPIKAAKGRRPVLFTGEVDITISYETYVKAQKLDNIFILYSSCLNLNL